ncbi:glycine betaine ABC transporter substrate-binding protein [Sphingobacterium phlebotomi]|uniref:glycine betaine ABC transporter substrate-binding protein n=1 Tax=Sphingobacterium phlebotomi TaxID=2605433 RepID=UPI001FE8214B|nr:glycine betaine ABC transporter substrate-binding protein [Sphingobacterium phlebotomi]
MKGMKWTLMIVTCFCLFGCGDHLTKRISMGMVEGWAEGNAMTTVAQEYLKEKGYHIVIHKAAPNLLLASMDNGDTDIFMNVWLPKTHGDKIAPFHNIQSVATNYEGALLGLVVPDYVEINSIEELNANIDRFDGKIMGIERGTGMAIYTDSVILAYDLNFRQLNSSMVAMAAELNKAINENRWIVVTAWQPHWLFGRFNLKFLEDPKKIYGEVEHIETFVRQDFDQDFPEVYRFFQHAFFDEEIMADLLTKMEASKNQKETAKKWIQQNRSMLDAWWGG